MLGVAPGIFRRGLTLPTRGLKYGFQGTINAKNLRKTGDSPSYGGLACSDGGYSPPLAPPLGRAIIYGCFFLEKGGIIDIIFSNMCGIMGIF